MRSVPRHSFAFQHSVLDKGRTLCKTKHKRCAKQIKRLCHPPKVRDTMIAGIVLANRATLATRNTQHFEDLSLTAINPWKI
jgi:hypothetical protein